MSSAEQQTMRVVEYDRYGGPEVLTVRERPVPRPGPGEVVVRVVASAVGSGESMIHAGRLRAVLRQRMPGKVGADFAGVVHAVAPGTPAAMRVGDRVWGVMPHSTFGGTAEFVAVPVARLASAPDGLDLVEAAALPASGTTAVHAVERVAELQAGERLLVRGGSGGVGSIAVQLGRARGAHVTALAGVGNLEWVLDLGADVALDHRTTGVDELRRHEGFDVVVDLVGSRLPAYRRLLRPDGRLVPLAIDPARPLRSIAGIQVSSALRGEQVRPFSNDPRPGELEDLTKLVEAGTLRALVHDRFPLDAVADAYRRSRAGGVRGKLVITMGAER